MPRKLAIIGAGGHAKVVLDVAVSMRRWDSFDFYDDSKRGGFQGWQIAGTCSDFVDLCSNSDADVFVAIGEASIRHQILEEISSLGCEVAILRHMLAFVSPSASLECGTVIMPYSVINAGSSIGRGCIINTGAIVEHGCSIGDTVHICPSATLAGDVIVGDNSWVGVGATVSNGVTILSGATIGAGAVVIRDVPKGFTVVGNPAKAIGKMCNGLDN